MAFFLKQTTFFVFFKKTKKTPAMELVNGHPSMLERFWSSHRPILESQRCMITMRLLLKSRTPPPQGGWVGGCPPPHPPGSGFPMCPFSMYFAPQAKINWKYPPLPAGRGLHRRCLESRSPLFGHFGLLVHHGLQTVGGLSSIETMDFPGLIWVSGCHTLHEFWGRLASGSNVFPLQGWTMPKLTSRNQNGKTWAKKENNLPHTCYGSQPKNGQHVLRFVEYGTQKLPGYGSQLKSGQGVLRFAGHGTQKSKNGQGVLQFKELLRASGFSSRTILSQSARKYSMVGKACPSSNHKLDST